MIFNKLSQQQFKKTPVMLRVILHPLKMALLYILDDRQNHKVTETHNKIILEQLAIPCYIGILSIKIIDRQTIC